MERCTLCLPLCRGTGDHRGALAGTTILWLAGKRGIMSVQKHFRCAIYTRKSTEAGLEQDFNSFDAQREACAAYITLQAGLAGRFRTRLAMTGASGGHMERPGLQALIRDISGGQVDIVVVYKVDRLTRSLADFARLVEMFENMESALSRSPRRSTPPAPWAA